MLIQTFTLKCRCTLNVNPGVPGDEYRIKNKGKQRDESVLSSLVSNVAQTKPFLSRACPDFHTWLIMHTHGAAFQTGYGKGRAR